MTLFKVETCRPDKYTILLQLLDLSSWRPDDDLVRSKHVALTNMLFYYSSWICLLGGPDEDLVRSKHVALTNIIFYK